MPVRSTPPARGETTNDSSQHQPSSPAPDRRPNGSASRGAWHGGDALSTIPQRLLRVTPGVSGVTDVLALRLLQRNAVYGTTSGTGVSRTRHMAPSAIDAKAAERSAPIVGHGCAQPSAAPRRQRLRTMMKAQRSPRVRVALPAKSDTRSECARVRFGCASRVRSTGSTTSTESGMRAESTPLRERLCRSDGLHWPHRDGLKWLHPSSGFLVFVS